MKPEITICLTSCGRFDLLERTIKSLIMKWWYDAPKAFIIYEDQNLSNEVYEFLQECLDMMVIELAPNWPDVQIFYGRVGQIRAIDTLYSHVQTDYIWHQEDDWEFYQTGFIEKSLSILEERPDISQVWIRDQNDRNGHPIKGNRLKTKDGVDYYMMETHYRNVWHGFSLNPGLRRLSDYKRIFPNGYSAVCEFDPKNPLKSEQLIGREYMRAGMKAATLTTGHIRHIGGNGRHVNLPL